MSARSVLLQSVRVETVRPGAAVLGATPDKTPRGATGEISSVAGAPSRGVRPTRTRVPTKRQAATAATHRSLGANRRRIPARSSRAPDPRRCACHECVDLFGPLAKAVPLGMDVGPDRRPRSPRALLRFARPDHSGAEPARSTVLSTPSFYGGDPSPFGTRSELGRTLWSSPSTSTWGDPRTSPGRWTEARGPCTQSPRWAGEKAEALPLLLLRLRLAGLLRHSNLDKTSTYFNEPTPPYSRGSRPNPATSRTRCGIKASDLPRWIRVDPRRRPSAVFPHC